LCRDGYQALVLYPVRTALNATIDPNDRVSDDAITEEQHTKILAAAKKSQV
jgi:hypothetical protein